MVEPLGLWMLGYAVPGLEEGSSFVVGRWREEVRSVAVVLPRVELDDVLDGVWKMSRLTLLTWVEMGRHLLWVQPARLPSRYCSDCSSPATLSDSRQHCDPFELVLTRGQKDGGKKEKHGGIQFVLWISRVDV